MGRNHVTSDSLSRDWKCTRCCTTFAQKSSLSRHKKRCLSNIRAISRQKACERCTISKIRCDLARPSCGTCTSKSVECNYSRPPLEQGIESDTLTPAFARVGEPAMDLLAPPADHYLLEFFLNDSGKVFSEDKGSFWTHGEQIPVLKNHDDVSTASASSTPHPTIDNDQGSVLVMTFVLRVLRTWPSILAHSMAPPFIHPSEIQEDMKAPLKNCIATLAQLQSVDHSSLISNSSTEVITLLTEYKGYDEADLIAAVQAYVIYAIILLFPAEPQGRSHRADQGLVLGLQDITLHLATSGLVLEAETRSETPTWNAWTAMSAKRRTVLASHMLMWVWSLMHRYPPFACREIGFMLSPAPKVLWQASSHQWEERYRTWLRRWKDGPHRLEELMTIGPGFVVNDRTQKWLEESDEFGLLVMSEVNAIH